MTAVLTQPPDLRLAGKRVIDLRLGDYRDVLKDVCADLILTSPPYNIGSKAERRDGYRRDGRYDPKSFGAIRDYPDNLPEDEYQNSQEQFLIWAAGHLNPDGILVYSHKPRRNGRMIHPAEWFLRRQVRARLALMEEVIWDRGSTHNHGRKLMWPQTERLYIFRHADGAYRLDNTAALPFRSDIWRVFPDTRNSHNAPFPLTLANAVVAAWSAPGDLVCDPYAGSGTTAVAALQLGRRFVGAEILAKYHAQALERVAA